MGDRIKFNDDLGQHMTPARIAQLVCQELPGKLEFAVDYAAGHGDLLVPLLQRWPGLTVHAIDCDPARLSKAADALGSKAAVLGDGLSVELPPSFAPGHGRFGAILNPPFLPVSSGTHRELLEKAFPRTHSRHGWRRLEIAFLSRALIDARARSGWVAIILPSAFASGLQYQEYRRELLESYSVLKAIEIRDGHFRDTEASTTLLIVDAARDRTKKVKIGSYNTQTDRLREVYYGPVRSTQRLDATYWEAAHLHNATAPRLGDVGTEVTRGVRSRAEAARQRHWLLHTTDLAHHRGNRLYLDDIASKNRLDVFAETGDILLPRTGTRVRWQPVEVATGRAPISDHLLCIRAPKGFRRAIKESFRHPDFRTWLRSVSKGVCATVLTKRELLEMPIFSLG